MDAGEWDRARTLLADMKDVDEKSMGMLVEVRMVATVRAVLSYGLILSK